MPDSIELTPAPRGAVQVTRLDADGVPVAQDTRPFTTDAHYSAAARVLDVPKLALLRWVHALRSQADPAPLTVHLDGPPAPTFRVRGIRCAAGTGTQFTSFADALAYTGCPDAEPVIEWDGVEAVAAVDLDFHGTAAPEPALLTNDAQALSPRPSWFWATKSGGLRCVYVAAGALTAEELAGVAGVALLKRNTRPPGRNQARHPAPRLRRLQGPRAARSTACEQTAECGAVRQLCGAHSAEDDEVAAWLRRPRFRGRPALRTRALPGEPAAGGEQNSPPVRVFADHVFCHLCAAEGVTKGSRTPGYFPYGCSPQQASRQPAPPVRRTS
jgi:hypothetical protein